MATGGHAPGGTPLTDLQQLIAMGLAFVGVIAYAVLAKVFPNFHRKLFGGIFIDPPSRNWGREIGELKDKIEHMETHVPDTHSDALEAAVTDRIKNGNLSVDDLIALHRNLTDEDAIESAKMEQELAVDLEFDSAAKTKRKLVNVFIGINVSLSIVLLSVAFRGTFLTEIPIATQQILLGLYASMSLFIIYVYRASNARILVLLAVKEDNKRYYDAWRFIQSRTAPLTDSDCDVIKLLLTNRTEREKGQDHPYELVLKGISNSTILMRGGKVLSRKSDVGERE